MRPRLTAAIAAVIAALVLAASPVLAAPTKVDIRAISYQPTTVALTAQGGVVRWTNVTSPNRLHDVVSSFPGYFVSGLLGTGETYSRRFPSAGTFTYICSLHDVMLGAISVPLLGEVEVVDEVTRFRLTLGTGAQQPTSRYRYVLTMQAPGEVGLAVMKVSRGAVAVVAPSGPGEYRFVARLKDTVTRRPSGGSQVIVLVAPG